MDRGTPGGPEALIRGEGLYKVFGPRPERAHARLAAGETKDRIFETTGLTVAVQDATFDVRRGEIFVVMGLSGCGKSTLLRLVNRLVEPTAGTLRVLGQDVTQLSPRALVDLRRHHISMVFQHFALLPHLSVLDNAAFALEAAGVPKAKRRQRALAALEQVGLAQVAKSWPGDLSGGMQQRVGLARALAPEPTIVLMDEAFSALDPLIRHDMQDDLIRLQRERQLTVMFVSHDIDEAVRVGDRIAIMDAGRIVQIDSPQAIMAHPANDYVASFFSRHKPSAEVQPG